MTAGTARVEERTATTEPVVEAQNDRERAVETIAQLLSSGRPISEILEAAKRFAIQSKATQPNGDAATGKLTFHIVGKCCTEACYLGTGTSYVETALTEPIDATVRQEVAGSAVVLHQKNNTALIGRPSNRQQALKAAPRQRAWRAKLLGLLRPVIFWLVPALSLILVAMAGISIDAGVTQKATNALAIALAGTVPSSESAPFSSAAASTLVVQPKHAKPQRSEPDGAKRQSAEPDSAERPRTEPDHAERQLLQPDNAEAASAEPDRAEPRLTPEEIKALLDRGDALVSLSDITSARLFYERAATTGDAQAAVRLGATYDPAFLAQTKFGGVRGDGAIAEYWYERARELGAKPSEMPLHSDAPAELANEAGTISAAGIGNTEVEASNPMRGRQRRVQRR